MTTYRATSWLGVMGFVGVALLLLAACGDPVREHRFNGEGGGDGSGGGAQGRSQSDKIDLLLAIDNSSSMADKQQLLASAIPDLIQRLVNPRCVNASNTPQSPAATGPDATCSSGFHREFAPVTDIHLGIVSSSLGAVGADQCPANDANHANDDKGHLVDRGVDASATYAAKGFLAWDPSGKLSPPGESSATSLSSTLVDMVVGTGQNGCGYEMQLESVVRFLVDPSPYDHIEVGSGALAPAVPVGVDQTILDQRADFLRPDSLLAVLMLTDENDCSINTGAIDVGSQNYAVLDPSPFFKSSPACADDPNDACCFSCGISPPPGCASCSGSYTASEDNVNLRCWQQKRRYGFDALFPVQRYVNAFTQAKIDPTRSDLGGDAVQNPIFPGDKESRGSKLVFFSVMAGVPWQAIARDPSDIGGGLRNAGELADAGFFSSFVGDPDHHVSPTEPIMQEDFRKRGVSASQPNGGDRTIDTSAPDDLQYACIFPLAQVVPNGGDCSPNKNPGPSFDNPLCDPVTHTTQIKAKAYPSLRELAVVAGLGDQGVVGSVCPQTSSGTGAKDGYRPSVNAIVDAFVDRLSP